MARRANGAMEVDIAAVVGEWRSGLGRLINVHHRRLARILC